MSVIRRVFTAIVRRLRAEEGVVLLYALGAMAVVLGLSGAALAAVSYDTSGTASDTSQKQAYAAAQAGIQRYLFQLNTDNTYWTHCVPQSQLLNPSTEWIYNTGKPETNRLAVPGSLAETYAVMLLPAAGQNTYTSCSTADPVDSMVTSGSGSNAGTLRIAATGYGPNGAQRTIVAAIRQQNFLDYSYFTNYETSDPYVEVADAFASTGDQDTAIEPPDRCQGNSGCGGDYSAALNGGRSSDGNTYPGAIKQCSQYRFKGRQNQPFFSDSYGGYYFFGFHYGGSTLTAPCTSIEFINNDQLNGPFHSNDSVLTCGNPSFGQSGYNDSIEFGGDPNVYPLGWTPATSAQGCNQSSSPTFNGKLTAQDGPPLSFPNIVSLSSVAGTSYSGTTCLILGTSNIQVAQPAAGQSCATSSLSYSPINYPSNGVLYVNDSTSKPCNYTYDVDDPVYAVSSSNIGCGTVFVKGVAGQPLTIGSARDTVIDGPLTYPSPNTNSAILGLIANGFIRVYHPVTGGVCTSNGASNANGYTPITQIDAAMLSLQHSFIVDNYSCGANLGTLNVDGAIAQNFRGVVGSGSAGYTKSYTYDRRLQYAEPPHFLAPTNGAFLIAHQTECDSPVNSNPSSPGGCQATS